jgi:luciferase family oxidoreductase group 1
MGLPLSVLDLIPRAEGTTSSQALRQSLEIARLVDRLGYTRLWYAEHHNMANIASTTPSIMIALAAEATERIRVGSGGVMLPNHAALQVAEAFRMLESLAPGRIDLGLGRAPGTDATTAMALRGSVSAVEQDLFPAKLAELMAFGRNSFPDRHPYKSVSAQPDDVPLPPLWLLGSSAYSAHLAASLGVGYGFAAHFSDLPPEGPMRAYRDEFESQGTLDAPHALLTLSVIVADTQDEVERQTSGFMVNIAQALTSQRVRLLDPEEARRYAFTPRERAIAESFKAKLIAGTPEVVKSRIDELVARTGADEVMVSTMVYDFAARKRSLELLAEAFDLQSAVAPAGRGA